MNHGAVRLPVRSSSWSSALPGVAMILASCAATQVEPKSAHHSSKSELRPQPKPVGDVVVGDVAVADIDGDGYVDLIVGLPGSSERGRERPGRVAWWRGGKGGLAARPAGVFVEPAISPKSPVDSFGSALMAVGDVNRDGFADLVVGAPNAGICGGSRDAKLPPLGGGRVYLFLGARTGFGAAPAAFVDGERTGGRLGVGFRGAGDVDGDGYPEIVVDAGGRGRQICGDAYGPQPAVLPLPVPPAEVVFRWTPDGFSRWSAGDEPQAGAEASDEGKVSLFVSGDFNRDGRADMLSSILVPGALSSAGAMAIGDVNGDGIPDLAVGHAEHARGRLYFYPGAAGRGISEPPTATLIAPLRVVPGVPPSASDEAFLSQTSFGTAVAVTDVDHDGFADVVVGAPWEDKIYVYAGGRAGPGEPARQVLAGKRHSWFPDHMVAGDFDGDGYGDIAAIDMGITPGWPSPGPTLIVYRGSPAGLATAPSLSVRLADVVN